MSATPSENEDNNRSPRRSFGLRNINPLRLFTSRSQPQSPNDAESTFAAQDDDDAGVFGFSSSPHGFPDPIIVGGEASSAFNPRHGSSSAFSWRRGPNSAQALSTTSRRSTIAVSNSSFVDRQMNRSLNSLPHSMLTLEAGSLGGVYGTSQRANNRSRSRRRNSQGYSIREASPSGRSVTELVHDTRLDNDDYQNPFTANGVEVPHPRRYLLENKEPEDFMEPEQRDQYLKDIEEFQKQWDQGGTPNPPAIDIYMTQQKYQLYHAHLQYCYTQAIRYWKMRTRAWFKWLDLEGIPFQVSCPRRDMPSVIPAGEFEKDPVFAEMEAIEDNLKHYDDFRWTASQQLKMGNPRNMVTNQFQVPVNPSTISSGIPQQVIIVNQDTTR